MEMDKEMEGGLGKDFGIDQNYIINPNESGSGEKMTKFAKLEHPNGRFMEVSTTAPGV